MSNNKRNRVVESSQPQQANERARSWLVNLALTGIVLGATVAPQVYLERSNIYLTLVGALGVVIALFSLRIALQWDRAIVLRLGRFRGLRGPGVFWLIPVIDRISRFVDMRVRATDFSSESTLTEDAVPVNVDAICFWMVWDAQKAVLEVEDFYKAIVLSAQTALRDIIGTHTLAQMLTQRERLGKMLQETLDAKTNPWGITVQSVEIRDVIIPKGLEDAMSKQAQAERERQARITLGTAETEIAAKFVEAARPYQNNPVAVHLRAMNMLYEGLKEKGSMIIVPSTAVETMNLGAIGGLAALSSIDTQATTVPTPASAPPTSRGPG